MVQHVRKAQALPQMGTVAMAAEPATRRTTTDRSREARAIARAETTSSFPVIALITAVAKHQTRKDFMDKQSKICRPWIVRVPDLRRYLGRACDALDSNLARVIFFEARIGKKRERRWLMLMSIEVTWAQLVSENAVFAAGRARRVCLADLPPLRPPRGPHHG